MNEIRMLRKLKSMKSMRRKLAKRLRTDQLKKRKARIQARAKIKEGKQL